MGMLLRNRGNNFSCSSVEADNWFQNIHSTTEAYFSQSRNGAVEMTPRQIRQLTIERLCFEGPHGSNREYSGMSSELASAHYRNGHPQERQLSQNNVKIHEVQYTSSRYVIEVNSGIRQ